MIANTDILFEQNKIGIPKEVQFYIQNEDPILSQPAEPILVSKEIKEMVDKSGLFRDEDKEKFVSKNQ